MTTEEILLIVTYLGIPISSGIIGWITNVIALKMTFYPIEYFGIRPFGWQGIVPAKSYKIADKSVDLLSIKLLQMEEYFGRIDPKRVAEEMSPALKKISKQIINEVMEARAPIAWESTPQTIKQLVYQKASDDLPKVIADVMEDLKKNIRQMLDLKALSLQVLLKDKDLLNQIFLKCGKDEFKFIENSGFYFGILFGIVQSVLFYYFQYWWLLPVFGFVVGFATNWIAIEMIFRPKKPIRLGFVTIIGLFFKRQKEVSAEYSKIVSSKILTTERIFEFIIRGQGSKKFEELVRKHVGRVVENTAGVSKTLFEMAGGEKQIDIIKNIATFRFMQELPIAIRDAFPYVSHALNIEENLREKMSSLSYEEFEGFLRPAFQEDEITLIIVGAFLGALAGLGQEFLIFI
ncbi:MAG: DUF445 family protein [Flammeovirgaceae bacterium]